jgi:acetylornithine deacetylase/succinyl-diaminopimelate desuccinylase-like protein
MRTRFLHVAITFLLVSSGCGRAQSLAPDLALNFACDEKSHVPAAAMIEDFLKSHGFDFVDEERVRRQYGKGFYPMQIEGFDKARRTIEFMGISYERKGPVNLRTVSLDSPPPTRHDQALERDIKDFVTQGLQCKITAENHGDNPPDRKPFYDQIYADLQSRLREGKVCDKGSKTFDLAACQNVPGTR